MRATSKADLEQFRSELKEDIAGLDVKIAEIDTKIDRQTGATIKWVGRT